MNAFFRLAFGAARPACLALLWFTHPGAGFGQVPVYTGTAPAPVAKPAPARAPTPAPAPAPPPSAPAQASATDLEKLAMPIALHPDPLVSIILPASAYPLEIVQAARFVKDTNNIPKVDAQPWDENVKAVAKFPELISMMDTNLEWTVALGQAFIDQPKELMDTIQALRAKAQKAGTLRSSPQQVVTVTNVVVVQTNLTQVVNVTNQIVQVVPANPQVIYVPSYPSTVYYPPPYYDPWAPLVTFGVGMAVGAIIANNCDWHSGGIYVGHHGVVAWGGGYHGDVDIDIDNVNIDRNNRSTSSGQRTSATGAQASQQKWQPDQSRLRSSGAPATAKSMEARGWGSGGTQPAARPSTGTAGTRPSQVPSSGLSGSRPTTQPGYSPAARPSTGAQPARTTGLGQATPRPGTVPQPTAPGRATPSPSNFGSSPSSSSYNRPSPQPSTAFGGVNSGSSARSAGYRGATSRAGGGGMRGGGRR